MADNHHHDPLDPDHLIAHVNDAEFFEVPKFISASGHLDIPQPLKTEEPIWHPQLAEEGLLSTLVQPFNLGLTKFMILEVVAAVLLVVVFTWLARKIATGKPPQGVVWNLLEAMLLFIRDQVARPAIGKHDADKFLPFLWTIFFFILGCNLLGMVPWAGSPTGSIATTGTLALITFGVVVGSGMTKLGPVGFWAAQVPHIELNLALAVVLKPMIFFIEVLGLCIKHFVLAVRLLANMLAGHLVLAVIVAFIAAAAQSSLALVFVVTPASIFGATALSMLELFVAFLQAYIFTFLSALFIGMAVHPH